MLSRSLSLFPSTDVLYSFLCHTPHLNWVIFSSLHFMLRSAYSKFLPFTHIKRFASSVFDFLKSLSCSVEVEDLYVNRREKARCWSTLAGSRRRGEVGAWRLPGCWKRAKITLAQSVTSSDLLLPWMSVVSNLHLAVKAQNQSFFAILWPTVWYLCKVTFAAAEGCFCPFAAGCYLCHLLLGPPYFKMAFFLSHSFFL